MSFRDKTKATANKWMNGRNGADMLGAASLWGGLLLTILDLFLRTGALAACGLVLYGYSIFRMFSKNKGKRAHENNRFTRYVTEHKKVRNRDGYALRTSESISTSVAQSVAR